MKQLSIEVVVTGGLSRRTFPLNLTCLRSVLSFQLKVDYQVLSPVYFQILKKVPWNPRKVQNLVKLLHVTESLLITVYHRN